MAGISRTVIIFALLVVVIALVLTIASQVADGGLASVFNTARFNILVFVLLFAFLISLFTEWARRGQSLFIRRLAGLDAMEEAVGRATEMGRPVLFIPGLQELDEIETVAGVTILGRVARITAQYETPLVVPVRYPMVMAAGMEICEQAYAEAGRKDSYNPDTVRYVAGDQMAFAASVNGFMVREKPAANIFMGAFFAESLIIAETGNAAGSIQIAGTARPEQVPFFVAACDYTLMGEELYAASAYLSHEPLLLGGLKGQDAMKLIITAAVVIGALAMLFGGTGPDGWFATFRQLFEAK